MWAADLGDVGELLDVDESWTSFATTRVLIVSEAWPGDLAMYGPKILAVLQSFDAVFTCMENNGLEGVADSTTSLRHLPHGVVTDSYSPSLSGRRPIGILNYGRRDPVQHDVLRRWSEGAGGWYHYDTMGLGRTQDPVDHQRVLGRLLSESSFSVCNFGRFDESDRRQGAKELGARFYEALGAGCVIVGDFPGTPIFEAHFADVPGKVAFPLGASHCPDEIARLIAAPEELARIHRVHRALALDQHDIAHRIAQVLADVGFDLPPALSDRQAELRTTAGQLWAA